MSNPDRSIDPRILEAAREEFLSKSYDIVSLREICSKAGVTTGAFYNRYRNKEELFDALVAPTLALVEEYSDQTEKISYTRLNEEDLRRIWEKTPENQRKIIDMFYDNYDGFKLLLCHAEGTKYANFLHDFVSEVTARSLRFITEAHRRGSVTGLIGSNGAGKSTLLRCICGLEKNCAGSIEVNGKDYSEKRLSLFAILSCRT